MSNFAHRCDNSFFQFAFQLCLRVYVYLCMFAIHFQTYVYLCMSTLCMTKGLSRLLSPYRTHPCPACHWRGPIFRRQTFVSKTVWDGRGVIGPGFEHILLYSLESHHSATPRAPDAARPAWRNLWGAGGRANRIPPLLKELSSRRSRAQGIPIEPEVFL